MTKEKAKSEIKKYLHKNFKRLVSKLKYRHYDLFYPWENQMINDFVKLVPKNLKEWNAKGVDSNFIEYHSKDNLPIS